METLLLEVGPLRFDAVAQGPVDGRPVLLLHGFPQSARSWRGQLSALADAGYRAVALDQRGYSPGARPTEVSAYAMSELVADVVGVLDALGWQRSDLVGHDWGAAVGWHVAGRHGDRLRSLTAVSIPHPVAFGAALANDPDQKRRSGYMRTWREPGAEDALSADDAAGLRALFSDAQAVDVDHVVRRMLEPGALTAALAWYRAAGRYAGLGEIEVPTLHVWSSGDRAVGRTATMATAEHVAGSYRLEVLDGVSHWVPEDAVARLSEVLLDHLAAT